MIRKFFKRAGLLISALFLFYSTVSAQIDNFDFLRSSTADATTYLRAYLAPWTNAFGAGLNGGWYNTAKPHKLLGFDITTSFNVGIVPESAGEMDISSLGLTSLEGSGKTPTISGPDEWGPQMTYQVTQGGETYNLATFDAPPGTNWRYIPVPTAQIGLGLPLGTEIKGRFIPKITVQDGDISLWGIGLMHNITQYIPGDKLLPFDVSVFGGYTRLEGNVPVSLQPEESMPQNYSPTVSFDGQKLNAIMTGLNVSAIASFNLPIISFYGGLGYSKTKTDIKLIGNFPTPVLVTSPEPHVEYNNSGVKTGDAFPAISIENFSGVRANIGFRLKFAVITFHADYTRAQYNVLSAGFGISIR